MARLIDNDTRLIDIDFGPVSTFTQRNQLEQNPVSTSVGLNGVNQLIRADGVPDVSATNFKLGSFVQYQMIDLEYMTMNNEIVQPVEVNVQRTSSTPTGTHENGNNYLPIEEYLFVFSRPLNHEELNLSNFTYSDFALMGLDRSQGTGTLRELGGVNAGYPTHEQTIYAERRRYAFNGNFGATLANGELVTDPVSGLPNGVLNSIYPTPSLESVTTWGTMSAITGPSLHCYRVVVFDGQTFPANELVFSNVALGGLTTLQYPPVNITFVCKDPKYTEGEYLVRLANAMNSIPEDGPTA